MISGFYSGREHSAGSVPNTWYLQSHWGYPAAEHMWAVDIKLLRGNLKGNWDSNKANRTRSLFKASEGDQVGIPRGQSRDRGGEETDLILKVVRYKGQILHKLSFQER